MLNQNKSKRNIKMFKTRLIKEQIYYWKNYVIHQKNNLQMPIPLQFNNLIH